MASENVKEFTDQNFEQEVLQSDHCFDAVLSAYTAYLWARDGWPTPDGCFTDDGWIVAPP